MINLIGCLDALRWIEKNIVEDQIAALHDMFCPDLIVVQHGFIGVAAINKKKAKRRFLTLKP